MDSSTPDHPLLPVARRALTHWDLDRASVELLSVSENVAFRVTAADRARYVLRIHRPGYHTLEELHSEQIWTAALRAGGLNVPVPVMTREGARYATVTLPETNEQRHVGILHWVEGVSLQEHLGETPTATEIQKWYVQIGGIIARIHAVTEDWRPPPGFQRHSFDADGIAGEAPFWGRYWDHPDLSPAVRQDLDRIRHKVHNRLCELPQDPARYGMIHADLHSSNLLTKDGRLHVIDFDDAGFGWHQYDLAVALFGQETKPNFDLARNAIFDGYRSERPTGDDFFELVPLFMLIRGLALIGWLMERPEHQHPALVDSLAESTREQAKELL